MDLDLFMGITLMLGIWIAVATASSLLIAIVLRVATKWVIKQPLPYGSAYLTILLAQLTNAVIAFGLRFAVDPLQPLMDPETALALIMLPIGFLIQSRFISWRLKTGFGPACMVSLAMLGVLVGFAAGVGALCFLIAKAIL